MARFIALLICLVSSSAFGAFPEPARPPQLYAINERGQIAANAFDATIFEPVGFLLTPVLGEESCNR